MAPSPPSSVSLGSCVAGIPVTLHYSFFLLLALEFVNAIIHHSKDYPVFILFVLVLYGPVLLFTIVVRNDPSAPCCSEICWPAMKLKSHPNCCSR